MTLVIVIIDDSVFNDIIVIRLVFFRINSGKKSKPSRVSTIVNCGLIESVLFNTSDAISRVGEPEWSEKYNVERSYGTRLLLIDTSVV